MTTTEEKLVRLREQLSILICEHETFQGRKTDLEYEIAIAEQNMLKEKGLISEDLQKKLQLDLEMISKLVPKNDAGSSIELKHTQAGNWEWVVDVSSCFRSALSGYSDNEAHIEYNFTIKTINPHVESIVTKYLNQTYCKVEDTTPFDREYKGCSCCPGSLHINIPKTRWGYSGY